MALPAHLRKLGRTDDEVEVAVDGAVTASSVLDALEERLPMLRGTIREHGSLKRRAYMRYFADGNDISHDDPHLPLPAAVVEGREPLIVMGAISGG